MPFDIQAYLQKKSFITGSGPSSAKLMIVGGWPNEYDDMKKEPFSGPMGALVDEMLKKGGSSLSACYRTNVYQKRPPDNKIKFIPKEEINKGKQYLWSTIKSLQPNCILALGPLALEVCTGKKGISEHRGSILSSLEGIPKVVSTLNPGDLIRPKGDGAIGYESRSYVQLDINRAIDESRSRELKLPSRLLEVAKSSFDLYKFRQAYKDKKRAAADIEVKNCLPICVSLAFDPFHAMSIPLFNLRGFDPFIPEHQYPEIYQILYEIFQECEIIGQNWKFDSSKLDIIGLTTPRFYADTMLMAHVLHSELPKSLQFLTSIYTREPYYKSELKEFNWNSSNVNDMFLYNAKDSAVTFEVYNAMIRDLVDKGFDDFYFNFQHKLHFLYQDIERCGIKVDRGIQQQLWDDYTKLEIKLQSELEILIDHPINIASVKQVRKLLYEELGFPERKNKKFRATPFELREFGAQDEFDEGGLATDEETLVSLYGNHADIEIKKRVIDVLLELRGVKKSKNTYVSCEPDYDGRMKWSYKIV